MQPLRRPRRVGHRTWEPESPGPSADTRTDEGNESCLIKLTKYEKALVALFVITLPLINPWVRGDGVGYYAFARSILIEHRLDFTEDWLRANESFRMGRVGADGRLRPEEFTSTGRIDNHFTVGPAILWSPFLIAAHAGVILYDRLGGHVAADGFSRPYRVAMALGTAIYGFLGLLLSLWLARRFVEERWAFLATLGIWFASSVPVYMYFNPSWSHTHSVFAVALFVWYWVETRGGRTLAQWIVLGAVGGLMVNVYYVNGVFLLLPLFESLGEHWQALRNGLAQDTGRLLLKNAAFVATLVIALLPTLLARKVIYGSYITTGYEDLWAWSSPYILKVCFSSDHGLFTWTPVLIFSVAGLLFATRDRQLRINWIMVFATYLYVIGSYVSWDGNSSFGSRYFVPFTPLFVLGLAQVLDWLSHAWQERRAAILAWSGTAVLVLWNLGLIFQWGMHLIPDRGPISWRQAAVNQVSAVPEQATESLRNYFLHRRELMNRIEQKDVNQIKKSEQSEGTGPTQ